MNILDYQSFYLVGIKGVAMTALAQCLIDAGKKVRGSDVPEAFVTQKILDNLHLHFYDSFTAEIPADVDCVIYTAAHQSQQNPQVQQAQAQKIPVITQAQALAELFNQKKGVAVCGVGGKSTTSAMIAWIFESATREQLMPRQSFAVGVGNISGLNKTGQWNPAADSQYFVAEADEYVTDPSAPSRGEAITPRFSFLKPFITVCTNLRYDHPDVYRDFAHTQQVYGEFFRNILPGGKLIINADDQALVTLVKQMPETTVLSFGTQVSASLQLVVFNSLAGQTTSTVTDHQKNYQLVLHIPGQFNVLNALAATLASVQLGIPLENCLKYLSTFRSTLRRSEFIGEKNGVKYYDDYAHHPNEVKQVIQAFRQWFPTQKLVVAFQSHTYSRTKALLPEFATAFDAADQVVMTDIFASAREAKDDTMTSDVLCAAINSHDPHLKAMNLKTNQALAEYCREQLHAGDVLLTLGAGDIYQVHDLLI